MVIVNQLLFDGDLSESQQRELLKLVPPSICLSMSPASGGHSYLCSRLEGHDGPHVAASGRVFCAAWPNVNDLPHDDGDVSDHQQREA